MGDNDYTLTLSDGTWTATFAPRTMDVGLGINGSVTLTQVEAGGYMLPDGTMVAEGTTTDASNGATYALTMGEDGTYMATYVPDFADRHARRPGRRDHAGQAREPDGLRHGG